MRHLFIDIETLPCRKEDAPPVKVPGNYKDPAKIEEYIRTNAKESWLDTALDPLQGRILAIGFALDDDTVQVTYNVPESTTACLLQLESYLERNGALDEKLTWVGHNIVGFDLRWLHLHTAKYLKNSRLYRALPHALDCADTMLMSSGRGQYTSLEKLAKFFGLGGKTGSGSKVFEMWVNGQHDDIISYCAHDVSLVRDIYRKMT